MCFAAGKHMGKCQQQVCCLHQTVWHKSFVYAFVFLAVHKCPGATTIQYDWYISIACKESTTINAQHNESKKAQGWSDCPADQAIHLLYLNSPNQLAAAAEALHILSTKLEALAASPAHEHMHAGVISEGRRNSRHDAPCCMSP